MKNFYYLISIFSLCLLVHPYSYLFAQSASRDTIPIDYSDFEFINSGANLISDSGRLDSFFQKLKALEKGEIESVSIVHIGDSHIQADFWTGEMRQLFQSKFGDRGRGFVFPFVLAESHNPLDIHITSNVQWDYKRSIFNSGPPMGVGGAAIATDNPEFYLDIVLGDSIHPHKFNKITLFNQKGPAAFDFTLGKGDVKKADMKKQPTKRKYHRVRSGETLSQPGQKVWY